MLVAINGMNIRTVRGCTLEEVTRSKRYEVCPHNCCWIAKTLVFMLECRGDFMIKLYEFCVFALSFGVTFDTPQLMKCDPAGELIP